LKERERLNERRALSPVISAVILTAAVLTVGCSIWFFSQSAMTITAEDYAESVINMTETISERFIIEQVIYDPETHILSIWVFNYGDINIEVNVTYPGNDVRWKEVSSKNLEEISFEFIPDSEIVEVGINVETRRGNDAYYRFVVPS